MQFVQVLHQRGIVRVVILRKIDLILRKRVRMDRKESGKPSPPHFKECPTEIVARKYEAVQPSFFQIALARFKKRRDVATVNAGLSG